MSTDNVPHQGSQAVSRFLYQDHWFQVITRVVVTHSSKQKEFGLALTLYPHISYMQAEDALCRLIEKLDFPDSKFSLYFLGYHDESETPEDRKERVCSHSRTQPINVCASNSI